MMSTCCSKHMEAWNEYIKKDCIKLVINQNYVKMHGQQNIKKGQRSYHLRSTKVKVLDHRKEYQILKDGYCSAVRPHLAIYSLLSQVIQTLQIFLLKFQHSCLEKDETVFAFVSFHDAISICLISYLHIEDLRIPSAYAQLSCLFWCELSF
jgi:hypothetical protein